GILAKKRGAAAMAAPRISFASFPHGCGTSGAAASYISNATSIQPGAAVLHAHVGTLADAVQFGLVDRRGAAVIHAHMHGIAAAVAFDSVLDGVAGNRATSRAGRYGDVAAAFAVGIPARQLLGGDGAHDAAQDRAGDVGAAVAGGGLDRDHRAAVVAAAGRRRGRSRSVAGAVAGRGTGAAGQCERRDGGDTGHAHADVHGKLLSSG